MEQYIVIHAIVLPIYCHTLIPIRQLKETLVKLEDRAITDIILNPRNSL